MLLLLLACARDPGELPEDCDPRAMVAGEVRAKRVACDDELIPGGEGRPDDWLLENAVARFVVRDTYAALTQLDVEGGTLVDAAGPGETDLLMELVLGEGRENPVVENESRVSRVRFDGVVYSLEADSPTLDIADASGAPLSGLWVPRPGAEHTDRSVRWEGAFGAVLGEANPDVAASEWGQVPLEAVSGYTLSPAARPDTVETPLELDADEVSVSVGGLPYDTVPVTEGAAIVLAPEGAELTAVREGCEADGLVLGACGGFTVRVVDDSGRPIPATVHTGAGDWPLPRGGGRAPIGAATTEAWVWAGPAYTAWRGVVAGESEAAVVLTRRITPRTWASGPEPQDYSTGGTALAHFGAEAAPDPGVGAPASRVLSTLRAQGIDLAVLIADDEVPVLDGSSDLDPPLTLLGSRTAGEVWTWGWTSTTRRGGHGAVDWADFGPLDRLTLQRGGLGADRFTIVTPGWVEAALAEAPSWAWPVEPKGLWMESLADVDALVALAEAYVDAAPVAAATWLPFEGALNTPALLQPLYAHAASAGNGPLITVTRLMDDATDYTRYQVEVSGPAWMGLHTLRLQGPAGEVSFPVSDTPQVVGVREGEWSIVTVEGDTSRPWGGEPAWAVAPVLWP